MERAPRPRRNPRTLILALLAALAIALTTLAGPVAAKPPKSPPGLAKVAEARTVTVMTRNLYLGAELGTILEAFAEGDQAVVGAASRTWGQAVASHPPARMAAIAGEIIAERPHVVGLQEVTRFTLYDYDPESGEATNGTVAYDFLDLLMAELNADGPAYRVVEGATAENFTSDPIPILAGAPYPTKAVQLLDRDVVIVRDDVRTKNARNGSFDNVLQPPLTPLRIDRGWGSVDLMVKPVRFRFVNAHLEAFGDEAIRVAEVMELFAAQAQNKRGGRGLPAVYAGDFNSVAPSGGGYQALLAGGLHDLWLQARDRVGDGDTCCQAAHLRNETSLLDERIDLLLGTRGVKALRADLVGDEPVDLPDGVRWASDHAGVVADVVVRPGR